MKLKLLFFVFIVSISCKKEKVEIRFNDETFIKDNGTNYSCNIDTLKFQYTSNNRGINKGILTYIQCWDLAFPAELIFDFEIKSDSIELVMIPESFLYTDDRWRKYYNRKYYFKRRFIRSNSGLLEFSLNNFVHYSNNFYVKVQ